MVASGVRLVLAVQAASVALVAGWFATGHASAPDGGLLQVDVLSLSERVPGLVAVDGRPTMVVLTCDRLAVRPELRHRTAHLTLPEPASRYGLVVSTDPVLAARLALPLAPAACQPGYVLLDGDSVVRYRTYDPGWQDHGFEQRVLLGALSRRTPPDQASPDQVSRDQVSPDQVSPDQVSGHDG